MALNLWGNRTQPGVARPKKQDTLLELGYAYFVPSGLVDFIIKIKSISLKG
jgi:hypothetical protein